MSADSDQIRITAEPQGLPQNCLYRLDRNLYAGTIYVSDIETARQWVPIAAAIMDGTEGVRGVRVNNAEILVTMASVPEDWRISARSTGTAIRTFLAGDARAVEENAAANLTGTDEIRARAQNIVDDQLNPGLASHGGWIEIMASDGADIYMSMGGGCQGCGSAQSTMKDGVEASLRNAVPEIGHIHDATDHAAGANPYM
ncbi:MAG: NifU family protein [Planctomycetes bacterium]|nr:NifU family protein [Planctomycetota bacterium]